MPAGAVTLTANGTANTYTISWDANNGSVVTAGATSGSYTSANLYPIASVSRSGYMYLGWALSSSATSASYGTSSNISVSALASDAGVANTNGATITLYAVWSSALTNSGSKGNMQSASCSSIAAGGYGTMTDSRDSTSYTIYRFPNSGTEGTDYPTGWGGYCLMTSDLNWGLNKTTDLSATTSTSNFDSNASNSSSETFTLSGTISITYRDSGTPANWAKDDVYTNRQYTWGTGANKDHVYYSWGAALVVCPKGWRLPTQTEASNITSFMDGGNAGSSAKIRSSPYNFVYGGRFVSSGFSSVGSRGYYWASTQNRYNSRYAYDLYFLTDSMAAGNSNFKHYGESVRCIAS